jgi:hypothetical protein
VFIALAAADAFTVSAQTPSPARAPMTAPPPAVSESGDVGDGKLPQLLRPGAALVGQASPNFFPASTTQYAIGDPTPEEQLYLELVNRARMNPAAEAVVWRDTTDPDVLSSYGYFGVDLTLMVSQIVPLSATQPLSFHPQLLEAARRHTMDMYVNNYQGHIGTDGSNPGLRLNSAGYSWNTYGENAFATARTVTHGHAGFEVDWGSGPGGMQSPAGHRLNIHNGNFREAGIGVTNGLRGSVGPQIVTQDFASRWGITPFITGVVYYDFNGNNFYDLGEGIGGVRVDVPGSAFFAVTANSGGYSVPVTTDGTYSVTFSGPDLPAKTLNVSVADGLNAKLDWVPAYTPPLLSGPPTIAVAWPTTYTFTPVGGATAYQWKQAKRVAAAGPEGAEGGTNNFSAVLSTNYALVQSVIKATGTNAFHLAQPQPVDQILNLNWVLRPGQNGQLAFASRLGWATPNQIARLQVSTNSGATWQDLWSRAGDNTPGQAAFSTVTTSLAPFASREILVRFAYDHTGGSYYYQTGAGIGWYVDDITCSNCEQLVNTQVADLSNTGFTFVPSESANYTLRVRARVGGGYLDWGPAALASASSSVIVVRITTMPVVANNRASFNFSLLNGNPASFLVESATSPLGPWSRDSTASIATLVTGSQYRATCAMNPAGRCFYRIVAR